METKTIVGIVVAIAVVAALVYFLGGKGGVAPAGANASTIMLAAVAKSVNMTSYQVSSWTSIDGALPINSTVLASGEKTRVIIADAAGFERTFYLLPEGNFVCIEGKGACLKVMENSSRAYRAMINYAKGQAGEADVQQIRRWFDMGVLETIGGVTEKTIAGRQCQEITYQFHFDKMGDAELAGTGYDSRTATAVVRIVKECLDKETGYLLQRDLNNTFLGESSTLFFNVTAFDPKKKSSESDFAVKWEIVDEGVFGEIEYEETMKRQCLLKPTAAEQDRCLEAEAYNRNSTAYCEMIGSSQGRDKCYVTFLSEWKDVAVCENAGSLKNDCYYEAAVSGIDKNACGNISEPEYEMLCKAVVGKDPAACETVVRGDECLYGIAAATGNGTICAGIKDPSLKKSCEGV